MFNRKAITAAAINGGVMMLPSRHWLAAALALLFLISLGMTACAETTSQAGPIAAECAATETEGPVVTITLGSPESDYCIVLTAASDAGDKDVPEAGGGQTANDSGDEILVLKKRIIELQNKGKLGFRKLVVCTKVDGYGIYSPMEPGKPSRRMVLYFEPANVSTLVTSDRYIIDCSVDLIAFDGSGKPVTGKKGVLKINRVSRSPVLDLFFRINLNLKKPPKKDLIIKTVLHDNIKNQSTSATYRINVKRKGKKDLNKV